MVVGTQRYDQALQDQIDRAVEASGALGDARIAWVELPSDPAALAKQLASPLSPDVVVLNLVLLDTFAN